MTLTKERIYITQSKRCLSITHRQIFFKEQNHV